MSVAIIGIDCATQANKVGLAQGYLSEGNLYIDKLLKPAKDDSVAEIVSDWIAAGPHTKHLLAVDAPLGWPAFLGQALFEHNAGGALGGEVNSLFRRDTDRFIKATTGKLPLDVGADRIARTAHAALTLLSDIKAEINLAWNPELETGAWAIETYPAATLKVSGLRYEGYKKKGQIDQRKEICNSLSKLMGFHESSRMLMENDADILDAAVCVLAGFHFINKLCVLPPDQDMAKKEGWIWVKSQDK